VIERVRGLGFADALAVAGAALVAAGLVVTGDGLVAAAQRTPGSAAMSWHDRLLLGLWNFRLEHALWFTIGLLTLWFALAIGATLLGRRDQTARLVGGVAVGFVLLAAAVAVGSTIVALSGSVGSGALQVSFTRNERIFTWLLQVATAASLSVAWLLAGSRLGEMATPALGGGRSESETEKPPGDVSPQRQDAERLLDELARAEQEGRADDVARLAAQIDAL
jgi:hypothetical protein